MSLRLRILAAQSLSLDLLHVINGNSTNFPVHAGREALQAPPIRRFVIHRTFSSQEMMQATQNNVFDSWLGQVCELGSIILTTLIFFLFPGFLVAYGSIKARLNLVSSHLSCSPQLPALQDESPHTLFVLPRNFVQSRFRSSSPTEEF
jgi:hypothetical protein